MPLPCAQGMPKPGVDAVVTMGGSGLAGFLTKVLGRKAAPFAAVLGYWSTQTNAFCQAGPPAFYQLTAADYANLVLESLGVASPDPTVINKLEQVVQYYTWWDLCQCVGTVTPPPTTSVEPPGAPGLNDTQGPPPNDACIDLTKGVNNRDATYQDPIDPTPRQIQNLTPLFFQSSTLQTRVDTVLVGSPSLPTVLMPTPPPISVTTHGSAAVSSTPGANFSIYFRTWNSTGAVVRKYVNTSLYQDGPNIWIPDVPFTPQAGETNFALYSEVAGGFVGGGYELHVQMNCVGASVATPCCPPDPTTNALLVQIKNLIERLSTASGAPATAWRDGPRHTGLGDRGHFVLGKGAVGVRAELTTIPVTSPPHVGDPTFYYDLGFITPTAIDVPLRGQRVLFNPQSFALPQFADGVAYTFLNGARGDLVELLPVV